MICCAVIEEHPKQRERSEGTSRHDCFAKGGGGLQFPGGGGPCVVSAVASYL